MNLGKIFVSYEYFKDRWRAYQIMNISRKKHDIDFIKNDCTNIVPTSHSEIKKWINFNIEESSCIMVLIGSTTFTRAWVKYEIGTAYKLQKGILGIYVHNLKDENNKKTYKGNNPFDYVFNGNGDMLSNYVDSFDSSYINCYDVYKDIEDNIEGLVDTSLKRRGSY